MDSNDDESISSKSGSGIGDEQFKSTATITTISMILTVFITGLIMIFNI